MVLVFSGVLHAHDLNSDKVVGLNCVGTVDQRVLLLRTRTRS